MIHIRRPERPRTIRIYVPDARRAGITPAQVESANATQFFTLATHYANEVKITTRQFNFRVYKDRSLGAALEFVFGNKCAYCESNFAHVTPKEIEHFRPKSEIDTGTTTLRPGYYWLAGEWENLLVSCVDCNRSRRHRVPGQSELVQLGKGSQFPLTSEIGRARSAQPGIGPEMRSQLLLDPCRDDPEQHLEFNDEGFVSARTSGRGRPSTKGVVSITAYALNRQPLVDRRKAVLNELRFKVEQLRSLALNIHDLTGSGLAATLQRQYEQMVLIAEHVRKMLGADAEYLAMLRDWIRRTAAQGQLDDLKALGIDLAREIDPHGPP